MKDEDILRKLNAAYDNCVSYYQEQRAAAEEDIKFRAGDQWNAEDKNAREAAGRPAETYNKLGQFVKQVVNNQKINRPEINIKAGDSNANRRTALILQSIIKNIQVKSFAENAYDTAFDCAVTTGEGYFRIVTKYSNPMSFDQDIFIESIDDASCVYIDPNFRSDYTNINYAFVTSIISKDEFEDSYPNAESSAMNYAGYEDNIWITEDSVKIVEYFYISHEEQEIHLLEGGIVVTDEDYQALKKKPEIKKSRKNTKKIVNWIKSNGHEILEKTTFPGETIPIIPVFGDIFKIKNKWYFEGIIRQAKSSQKRLNYVTNQSTEAVGLLSKAKYMLAEGMDEGHKKEWATMHTSSKPYVTYKPIGLDGQPNQPIPIQQDVPIQALAAVIQQSEADMKSTTGIYDPSLGKEKTGEASGIALITKQRQAEVTSFMYIDNLSKSLKLAGKILVDIIPKIYDNDRIIRIAKDNDTEDELVSLDQDVDVNFHVGEYDVEVTIGPYGENQRQEALNSMMALISAKPELIDVIGDIWVGKQDWAGAQEIASRMKKLLPAQLQDQEDGAQIPPELQAQIQQGQAAYENTIAQQQAQMQQMQILISDITQQLNRAKNDSENDRLKIVADDKKNAENNQVKLLIEMMKQGMPVDVVVQALAGQFGNIANQPIPQPQLSDEYVLAGVNDPITTATQVDPIENEVAQQQAQATDLTTDDRDDILSKLDQHLTQPKNVLR